MRYFNKGFSQYFDLFLKNNKNYNFNAIVGRASLELAKACIKLKERYGLPIVALDLAGAEAGNPPVYHQEAYSFAHQNLLDLTVHAGEAAGPESILQAVTKLYPKRIGHGFHLFSQEQIIEKTIKNKKEYIEKLTQYIAKQRITLEVCLTSNMQTIPSLKNIKNHPFAKMLDYNLSTVICTDNRTVSKTSLTKEIVAAIKNFNLTHDALKNLVINSFKKSFYPGPYIDKLNYIKKVSTYYDSLL